MLFIPPMQPKKPW